MRVLFWTVPHGIFLHGVSQLRKYQQKKKLAEKIPSLENRNERFKDCHKGERCFILATGPSINQQDLTPLKDEICISVNNFYVHKDYKIIQPMYHCIPDVVGWHKKYVNKEYAIKWFQEMEEKTGQTVLFLGYDDKRWIDHYGLFRNRKVYYLHCGSSMEGLEYTDMDLTRIVPGFTSVSVLALEIAIYMGCKDIYLLGCDHDWILTPDTLIHFYEEHEHILTTRPGFKYRFKENGVEDILHYCSKLWAEYKALRCYTEAKGLNIYNATKGGLLDVFPRVCYESLFTKQGTLRSL